MAAQKGKNFVLKISDGATTPAYAVVGGMRSTGITINNETVDISDKSNTWRELLPGAGIRSVSISASGVFKDTTTEGLINDAAMDDTLEDYQIVFEDGAMFAGAFQVTSLEYTGEYNGARQYSMSLESSGTVVYTPSA